MKDEANQGRIDRHFDGEMLHAMQEKLVVFLRHLAFHGFQVDVSLQRQAQQLLAENNFGDRYQLQYGLQTLLCKNRQQWRQFEQLYSDFWLINPRVRVVVKQAPQTAQKGVNSLEQATGEESKNRQGNGSNRSSGANEQTSGSKAIADLASAKEVDETIDFAFLEDARTLASFTQSCQQLADLLARRLRKKVHSSKGERIDLRQSIQHNLKHGGELLELIWQKRPKLLPSFTLMIDVSRSMSGYSNAFLIFALALVKVLPRTRVYIFNTRLVDITQALREQQLDNIKAQLDLLNTSWGGGTRIAHSLAQLDKYGRRYKGRKGASHYLLIHSDGLDTDPAHQLQQQLKRMQTQYRQIIWLSPLLKDARYKVETAALKAALPYIDALLPVHNLACLYRLADLMVSKGRAVEETAGVAYAG